MSLGRLFISRLNILSKFTRSYHPFPHGIMYAPNIAYLRYQTNEPQFQLTFRLLVQDSNVDRVFNFSRNLNENVDACMDRIRNNIEKEFNKKNKKKKPKKDTTDAPQVDATAPTEVFVGLMKNGQPLSGVSFSEILTDKTFCPDEYKLKILEQLFKFSFNTPWVNVITLPTSALAGFFVYPSKVDMECAQKTEAEYEWFSGMETTSKKDEDIVWNKVSDDFMYLATKEDIGKKLKIVCTPKRGDFKGPPVENVSKCVVQAGPGNCPFETRHLFTSEKTSKDIFRVTTYNLLADLYCDSDYSRKELFPYCPPYALHIDYRKQLFIKEIVGYNSDLICLQEVDSKIYDLDLSPILRLNGLDGVFKKKGDAAEGCATFFRTCRFELLEQYGLTVGEEVSTNPIFNELWDKLQYNQDLVKRLIDRPTVAQATLLKSKDNPTKHILIANTHLYFHPDADHVRLLQGGIIILYVQNIFEEILKKYNLASKDLSIIFCGDFNSVPECGIYKLFTEKHVPDDFIDWNSKPEEAVKGVSLRQPFNLQSACGTPKYTNYTVGFAACLDYIFYQTDNLKVSQVVPLPSDEELQAHSAIPSVVYPSDHVALVADLQYKDSL